MPDSIRSAQRGLTRSRFIDAAHQCFAENGYASTSIEDLARGAGTTRATFYLHFGSKADIAVAVWNDRVDRPTRQFWAELGPVVASLPTKATVLSEDWFPQVLSYWEERGPLIKAILEARTGHPDMAASMAETRLEVGKIIADALRAHSRFSDEALSIRAVAAFDLQAQLFMDWISDTIPRRRHLVIEALEDAWLALLI